MLEVASVENIRIKDLEFDGAGVADFGILVSGNAPGVSIENVAVRQVRIAGFKLQNVAGLPGRPVTLDRVRAQLTPANEAGVMVAVPPNATLQSKYLAIRNSRIEGPGKAGVRFDGAILDAEVTGNRLFKLDAAFLLGRVADGRPFKVQMAHNTVYEAKVGVQFGPASVGTGKVDMAITQNYFAKTPRLAEADAPVNGLTTAENGLVESGQGNVEIKVAPVANPPLPSANPDDDATFLRFPNGPPMSGANRIGAN
jgi:hypothetical protein